MPRSVHRAAFLDDLRARVERHGEILRREFLPRSEEALMQVPAPGSWSVSQCFDHLVATHAYYRPKIEEALEGEGEGEASASDDYRPSFWGRIYMFFALDSRWSFKVAAEMAPEAAPGPEALEAYQERLESLALLLESLGEVGLSETRVPIERGVAFNLGDCLRVLVYHDALHFKQARKALVDVDAASAEAEG